jgi:hypothetical protein
MIEPQLSYLVIISSLCVRHSQFPEGFRAVPVTGNIMFKRGRE